MRSHYKTDADFLAAFAREMAQRVGNESDSTPAPRLEQKVLPRVKLRYSKPAPIHRVKR